MRVLLDSQIIFWWLLDSNRLKSKAAAVLADLDNVCLISPVNHWEMALKISAGGFKLDHDFETSWQRVLARFPLLPIEPRHSAKLIDLPYHHRDPFDRMLIAQAIAENIPLVSSDRRFRDYPVQVIG